MQYFPDVEPIRYEGPQSTNPLAYRHYDRDEVVAGKRMEDHLRFAVAYWHSFAWPGGDPFGGQTLERPWFGDTMALAKLKADVAFEMFDILSVPFYCFHDADVRPEGASFVENTKNLNEIVDYFAQKQAETGVKLLWGTANMFSHRRYMSGAATNPDPDVFAFAAATVKTCMDATLKLGWLYEQREDYAQAQRYYQHAIGRGNSYAHWRMGLMHLHGLGCPANPDKAREHLQIACEQAHEAAYLDMAELLLDDEHNQEEALDWLQKAVAAEVPDARELAEELLRQQKKPGLLSRLFGKQ